MSFGFSVGDIIATTHLAHSVAKCLVANNGHTSSTVFSSANHELKDLIRCLSRLSDGLTSDESGKVLAQEEFQKPLRYGLAQIRRYLQTFKEALEEPNAIGKSFRAKDDWVQQGAILAELIGRLSKENANLKLLLTTSKDTHCLEVLSSLSNLSEVNSAVEDISLRLWLAGPQQKERHAALLSRLVEQTGSWILAEESFREWEESPRNSLLWLWGAPGSGKSVLSARIVEELLHHDASGRHVAFYHFNFNDLDGRSLERCLMSLISQFISRQSNLPDVVRKLYLDYAAGAVLPSVRALQEIILSLRPAPAGWYIVLDGIDECSNLEELLNFIKTLRHYGTEDVQKLRVLVASRRAYDIEAALTEDHTDGPTFNIMIDALDDVKLFIDHELERNAPRSGEFSTELKHQISAVLSRECLGQFTRARLALDRIYQAPTLNAVKQILKKPIPNLEDFYISLLREIPLQHDDLVRRVVIWIMNSARPMTLEELSEAVVVNKAGKSVNPEERLINGSDQNLKICSNFLIPTTTTNDRTGETQTTLQPIHMSFMEFLKSFRSKHLHSPLLGLQDSNGDRVLADRCISYLLSLDEEDRLGPNGKSPLSDGETSGSSLLSYASTYWPYHARRVENAQTWQSGTTELIMRLFHQNHGNTFANWLKMYRPEESAKERNTPIYYASLLGLKHVLESLLEAEEYNSTLELEAGLYGASSTGFADIVLLLLEKGASANAEHAPCDRPLDAAILNKHTTVVELLVDWKVDVTYEDGVTGSPLLTAISTGDTTMAGLVLVPTKASTSPAIFLDIVSQGLRDAARNGNLDVLQLLFNADQETDLDAVDKAGWTALHYAIRYKHNDIQQYLIDHGADFDKRNLAGETPADFAWSDRRLDLSLYDRTIDLKKEAKQAFSCHILQQVSDSADCTKVPPSSQPQTPLNVDHIKSIFRKTFRLKGKNRVAKTKAKKAIIREHTILQRINHPYIVSYLWYEEDNEQEAAQLYLEYCNGGDLDKYSARAITTGEDESSSDDNDPPPSSGPSLMPKELWLYMFQIAAALAYLHHGLSLRQDGVFTFERQWDQILHRDIKPSNIVLNTPKDGLVQAKLCDLGLAKGLSPKVKEAKETGGIGTRNYWPPELFQKAGFWTAKGDIYSYGSTFDDLWAKSTISNQDRRTPKEILGKCMSTKPADRPSSIELLEMTREYVVEELPLATSRLHGYLGQSKAGYLHGALYRIAGQLDTKESFQSRSVKVRRASLVKRLNHLCDDGAGVAFDSQPGSPDMRLHIAVLLRREAAFDEAIKMPQAVCSRWSDSRWTPLHLAAQEGNIDMYKRLLTAKADASRNDAYGASPSYYLSQYSGRGI